MIPENAKYSLCYTGEYYEIEELKSGFWMPHPQKFPKRELALIAIRDLAGVQYFDESGAPIEPKSEDVEAVAAMPPEE